MMRSARMWRNMRRTKKRSLGEATDISGMSGACYHTVRYSEAQMFYPRSIPYIRANGASCMVSDAATHSRCSDSIPTGQCKWLLNDIISEPPWR